MEIQLGFNRYFILENFPFSSFFFTNELTFVFSRNDKKKTIDEIQDLIIANSWKYVKISNSSCGRIWKINVTDVSRFISN